jgi:hypothetical protein
MTNRERKSAAVWLLMAPALIFFSACAAIGLYALIRGASSGDPIGIGLGLVTFPIGVYVVVKILRAPLRTRPNGSNPP